MVTKSAIFLAPWSGNNFESTYVHVDEITFDFHFVPPQSDIANRSK